MVVLRKKAADKHGLKKGKEGNEVSFSIFVRKETVYFFRGHQVQRQCIGTAHIFSSKERISRPVYRTMPVNILDNIF